MKKLKWIVLSLLAIVVIGVGIVWMNLNGIVKRTVESQASSSLDLKTTLGGANVSIFGGSLSLNDLQISSPPGYSAPQMISLGEAGVNVSLGELRGDPVHIKRINIDKPKFVIEASGTKLNFQSIMDRQSKTPADPKDGAPKEPIKLIIDQFDVTGAQVALRPGVSIPGVKEEYLLTLPSISLSNVGNGDGAQNGAAIKEVVTQLLSAVAAKAAESDQLPPELKQLLSLNVSEVRAQLEERVKGEVNKVTGDVQKRIDDAIKQNDPGKALEKGMGDLLGGDKKKDKPEEPKKAPKRPPSTKPSR